ncbi:hypothetical protein AYJ66_17435 [Dietzia cinnamea]|nr:hypothetical protein AYJ66_17435 [Dietzia cinnamea]
MLFDEFFMTINRVRTDTKDNSVHSFKTLMVIPEITRLSCAARSHILRVKIKHYILSCKIRKLDSFSIAGRQFKFRGFFSNT